MDTHPTTIHIASDDDNAASTFTIIVDWQKQVADEDAGTIVYSCGEEHREVLRINFLAHSVANGMMHILADLREVVYIYNGMRHEPRAVHIDLGIGLKFSGLLSSLDIKYEEFDEKGTPLSARILIVFEQHMK